MPNNQIKFLANKEGVKLTSMQTIVHGTSLRQLVDVCISSRSQLLHSHRRTLEQTIYSHFPLAYPKDPLYTKCQLQNHRPH